MKLRTLLRRFGDRWRRRGLHPAVNTPTNPPAGPPTWIDEFQQAMTWPNRRWSDPDLLDTVAAAADLDAWLHDRRPYKGMHEQGWTSAVADLEAAAKLIGPRLRAALGVDLTTALNETAGLPGKDPTPSLPAARSALATLRARWADPAALDAAWHDLANACRNHDTPYEAIAARRDLFWQLVRAADRNTEDLGRLLAGVLEDQALRICVARVQLGDIPAPATGAWPSPADLAGLADTDRLDLCQRLLATPATAAHHVVWVAFDRASLNGTSLAFGPITFYEAAWLHAALQQGGTGGGVPAELAHPGALLPHVRLPKGDRIVLARVDLGTGIFTDAPRVAAEQARAVVTIASVRAGGRPWRPLNGHAHAIDGRITNWSSFSPPFDRAAITSGHDRTAEKLGELAATLGARLPVTDPALTEAVDALSWWQDAADQPALAAIVLDVRVIELVAARVTHGAWYRFLDSHLAAGWIRSRIDSALNNVVFAAVNDYHGVIPENAYSQLMALEKTIFEPLAGSRWVFHADRAAAALPTLAAIWPIHDPTGRQIHTLAAHLATTATLDAWCRALHERWIRARERLQRSRNSLAHGGPLTPATAETVHRFGHRLAGGALGPTLEGLLDGHGSKQAHDGARDRMNTWRSGVPGAASVHDALFPW